MVDTASTHFAPSQLTEWLNTVHNRGSEKTDDLMCHAAAMVSGNSGFADEAHLHHSKKLPSYLSDGLAHTALRAPV